MTVVTSGEYGKPRPALIVQADAYAEHPSITVLPLTWSPPPEAHSRGRVYQMLVSTVWAR